MALPYRDSGPRGRPQTPDESVELLRLLVGDRHATAGAPRSGVDGHLEPERAAEVVLQRLEVGVGRRGLVRPGRPSPARRTSASV